jgi:hypothetical protein
MAKTGSILARRQGHLLLPGFAPRLQDGFLLPGQALPQPQGQGNHLLHGKPVNAQNYPHSASDWLETGFSTFWEFPKIWISWPQNQNGGNMVEVRQALGVFPKILEQKIDWQKKVKSRQFISFDATTYISMIHSENKIRVKKLYFVFYWTNSHS